jgi:glycosyltransferase involved in cell wall biosynthesis
LNLGEFVSKTLLWITHVPLCRDNHGQQVIDIQTCELLSHLIQEFDRIILGCINWDTLQEDVLTEWQPIADLPWINRIEILVLPETYNIRRFIAAYPQTRLQLRQAIERADYLCFLPASPIGDWPGMACIEAILQGRPFAIWNDRVERDILIQSLPNQLVWKRGLVRGLAYITGWYTHTLMKRATLGLLQGQSCREEFAIDLTNPHQHTHCFNYINTRPEDAIQAHELAAKLTALAAGEPLQIGYVGRADEMKGPLDWLAVLTQLKSLGVPFQATWIGDGLLLTQMKAIVQSQGLADQVQLLGAISDRQKLLSLTKSFHLILCCHRTAESARCLQEALVCGCPIVAYQSGYVAGLLEQYHCGIAKPLGDIAGLAAVLAEIHGDRQSIQAWMRSAAAAGATLNAEATFRQVGQLIKQFLDTDTDRSTRSSPSNPIPSNPIPSNPIPSNPSQSNPSQSSPS